MYMYFGELSYAFTFAVGLIHATLDFFQIHVERKKRNVSLYPTFVGPSCLSLIASIDMTWAKIIFLQICV